MLKNIFIGVLTSLAISQVSLATVQDNDPLHLAGTYQCHGYDSHDGDYKDATVKLILDAKHSDFSHHYGAYHFQLIEPNGILQYTGEAAASGNHLAIYFKSISTATTHDEGVGIAAVTHSKDKQGKVTTIFEKFYYEPDYQGGGNGFETCIKKI